jgi:hypothetical protein
MVNMNSKGNPLFSPTTFFKGDEGLSDVISCFSATRTIVITSGKGLENNRHGEFGDVDSATRVSGRLN